LSTALSWTGPRGEGSMTCSSRTATTSPSCRTQRLSLEGDAAATRRVIDAQDGPVVLVGHSYGGAVITEAGTDPKVAALVYIAAFAPDEGESVNTLNANPSHAIKPPKDGFVFQDREKFPASFGADLKPELAAFMADSQALGASAPEAGRSPNLPGGSSRAGTWSRPKTG
jgi:pimeloyl-ACP methyl ester carboxylesterase